MKRASDEPAERGRKRATVSTRNVDGYELHPQPVEALRREFDGTALSVVGGSLPLTAQEFARRAYLFHLDPLRNPVKEVMDAYDSVLDLPPMLAIFNDIPAHKMREDEVMSWAKAGFSIIVNDGEHGQLHCWMGKSENAMIARAGMLTVQRSHREALSELGDAYLSGARGTMRPYATTLAEAQEYYKAVDYPAGKPGSATKDDRGGYPARTGNRTLVFTPDALRAAESETQGWLQFETSEYILDPKVRDPVLDLMQKQGKNKAVGFVGPFDAVVRDGPNAAMTKGMNDLFGAGAERGIAFGRVCGSGSLTDPKGIEDSMVEAIEKGCRIISPHYFTSDLPFKGAEAVAAPFWKAVKRCGF
eukprot:TRINITY_DN26796_c0_g1_i1.p1 TRINITY_DN26796_c0_g1~~TRINITY_DN26796_c0_g1_i1.p1  ORF type:complete len:360 (-),score=70.06 TRINITY_DN26796_c0_g1_i1:81-1160(-)